MRLTCGSVRTADGWSTVIPCGPITAGNVLASHAARAAPWRAANRAHTAGPLAAVRSAPQSCHIRSVASTSSWLASGSWRSADAVSGNDPHPEPPAEEPGGWAEPCLEAERQEHADHRIGRQGRQELPADPEQLGKGLRVDAGDGGQLERALERPRGDDRRGQGARVRSGAGAGTGTTGRLPIGRRAGGSGKRRTAASSARGRRDVVHPADGVRDRSARVRRGEAEARDREADLGVRRVAGEDPVDHQAPPPMSEEPRSITRIGSA